MGFPRAGSIPAHSGALDCILCCKHCILEMHRSYDENAKHVGRQTSKWTLTASWSLTYVHFKLHKSKLQAACLLVELVVLLWPHALKILPRLAPFTSWSVCPRCTSQPGNIKCYFCCFVRHARQRFPTVLVDVLFTTKLSKLRMPRG